MSGFEKNRTWPCIRCGKVYLKAPSLRYHLLKIRCHDNSPLLSQQYCQGNKNNADNEKNPGPRKEMTKLQKEETLDSGTGTEAETPAWKAVKREPQLFSCTDQKPTLGEICFAIVKDEEEEECPVPSNDPPQTLATAIKTEPLDPDIPPATSSSCIWGSTSAISVIKNEAEEEEAWMEPVKEGKQWYCPHLKCSGVRRSGYVNRLRVLKHMRITHPDSYQGPKPGQRQRLYQCSMCGERFINRNTLTNHATSLHKRVPKDLFLQGQISRCQHCHTPFHLLETAGKCESQHEKGTVECPHCPSRFSVRWLLVRHLESFHERPGFPCMACRQDFINDSELLAHLKQGLCGSDERNAELIRMLLMSGARGGTRGSCSLWRNRRYLLSGEQF